MIANLSVRRTIAFVYVVAKTMASRALGERFGWDGDLGGNAFVVHESLFVEKFVDGGTCGIMYKNVSDTRGGIWVSGFGGPRGAVVKVEAC